jgi:hypothetical protein
VYELLDGTCLSLYHYRDQWHLASKYEADEPAQEMCTDVGPEGGSKDAEGGGGVPLAQLFWEIWRALGYNLPTDTSRCYTFELLCRRHRYLSRVEEDDIVLVCARDIRTLQELLPATVAEENKWHCVKSFGRVTGSDELLQEIQKLNPFKTPGFEVRDKNGRRMKILSNDFFRIYNTLAVQPSLSATPIILSPYIPDERRMLEIVRTCNVRHMEQVVHRIPHWKFRFVELWDQHEKMCELIDNHFEEVKDIKNMKEFAAVARKFWSSPILFILQKQPFRSAKEYFALCPSLDFFLFRAKLPH